MDEKTRQQLEKAQYVIELDNFSIRLAWSETDNRIVNAQISKRNPAEWKPLPFSEGDVQKLIEDLNDLSDWRHYRRLRNKLQTP